MCIAKDQGRSKYFKPETVPSEEIRNRHYIKTVCTDDVEAEKEGDYKKLFIMCDQGRRESDYEIPIDSLQSEIAESATVTDDTLLGYSCPTPHKVVQQTKCDIVDKINKYKEKDIAENKKGTIPVHSEPPEYAVISKAKKKPKDTNSQEPPSIPAPPYIYTETPYYEYEPSTNTVETKQLKKSFTSKTQALQRSASPVYDEARVVKKKQPQKPSSNKEIVMKQEYSVTKGSERGSSPEYAVVAKESKELNKSNHEDDHYYHSLENLTEESKDKGDEDHYYHSLENLTEGRS